MQKEKPKDEKNEEIMLDFLIYSKEPPANRSKPDSLTLAEAPLTWFMAPAWLSCPGC